MRVPVPIATALLITTAMFALSCATIPTLEDENYRDREFHKHLRLTSRVIRFPYTTPNSYIVCIQAEPAELRERPDACFTIGELRAQHLGRNHLVRGIRRTGEESLARPRGPLTD